MAWVTIADKNNIGKAAELFYDVLASEGVVKPRPSKQAFQSSKPLVKSSVEVNFNNSAPSWFLKRIEKLVYSGFFDSKPRFNTWKDHPDGLRPIHITRSVEGTYTARMPSNNGFGDRVKGGNSPKKPNDIMVKFTLSPDPQRGLRSGNE